MLNNERCRELQTEFKMATRGGRDLLLMLLKWIGLHYQRSKSISLVRIDKHTSMEANVGWTESDGWEEFVQYYSKIFENRKKKQQKQGSNSKKKTSQKMFILIHPPNCHVARYCGFDDIHLEYTCRKISAKAFAHTHTVTLSHTHTHEHGHLIAFTTTIFRYLSEAKLIVTPLLGTATE